MDRLPSSSSRVAPGAARPVFLSREERERIAAEHRKQEDEERRSLEREKIEREKEVKQNSDLSRKRKRDADEPSREERIERERLLHEYLVGKEKEKRKQIRSSSDRFNSSWSIADDTTRGASSWAQSPVQSAVLFGKGRIGGPTHSNKGQGTKETQNVDDGFSHPSRRKRRTLEDLHWSTKELAKMTERDWRILREDFAIVIRGGRVAPPLRNWMEMDVPEKIHEVLKAVGYEEPTAVQRQCIPIGLANRDMIGLASTGSGKTLAFLLPMLMFIHRLPKLDAKTQQDGPYAVILAPTRELAIQIEEEARKFCAPMGVRTVVVVGGQSIEEQALKLRLGCEVVIATPGRLNDCLNQRYVVLNQATYVVLDEADRMIDMGFEPQVQDVLDAMPLTNLKPLFDSEQELQEFMDQNKGVLYRQTFMFSATMKPEVERLARKYLRNPATVTVGEVGQAVDTVDQTVEMVPNEQRKRQGLRELLKRVKPPILVFINQKKSAEVLAKSIDRDGYRVVCLHGGRSQEQREAGLLGFKQGRYDVMVATMVAGRGIDIKGINEVVNYDMPTTIEDYVHRVGRTGRMGERGHATSFITPDDTDIMYDLRQMLLKTGQPVPRELEANPASQVKPGSITGKPRKDTVLYAK